MLVAIATDTILLAHAGSVAYWRLTFERDEAISQVLIALDDADRWIPASRMQPGKVSVSRLDTFGDAILQHFQVLRRGEAVPSRIVDASVLPSGLLELRVAHRIGNDVDSLSLRSTFHELTDDTHRVIARVDGRGVTGTWVLHASAAEQMLAWPAQDGAGPEQQASAASTMAMLRLGVEHILRGIDHLVFLACLLVAGGTWRSRIAVVSAFTVAHSLTLVLAAMRIVNLPPAFVEPAIAVSIAYVAAENLLGETDRSRWPTAFGFGLIHGFGFAGQLDLLNLPLAQWVTAVLAFNVGVEVGQLAVVAIVLPIVFAMARSAWHRRLVQCTSVLVLGLAVVWFVDRLP